MKFTKKPITVEAVQWNGNTNLAEIEKFVGCQLKTEMDSETAYIAGMGCPTFFLLIQTKEGIMKASKGDWIIKEPFATNDRFFYPCKPDIFELTYFPAEEQENNSELKKTFHNTDASGAKQNVKDIQFWGNGDLFKLISKASSKTEGWMKSTKAMEIEGVGCVIQVTTQQDDNVAEALTFVPGVRIAEITKVKSNGTEEVAERKIIPIERIINMDKG